MEYLKKLKDYGALPGLSAIEEIVRQARTAAVDDLSAETLKFCYGCIDLTSLNVTDNTESIREFVRKVVGFNDSFPGLPNVASICVFPNFIETIGLELGDSPVKITGVAGGFPASQTYLEVKMLEAAMAVENGADEIDIVINVGQLLEGRYDELANEIELVRSEIGEDIPLKVIVESGALREPELIRRASLLAMLAGADFVKTSTGKISEAATPEAAAVMCTAVREYFERTGRKVGFKAAGGIKTAEDALLYYSIVKNVLGEGWLTPSLFRIGASSAANNLLGTLTGRKIAYY